ncbi:membrane protein insertase YidC [Paenibacillus filicis]|uniref:Membrane protein insertase YidC n=1 Tax=Paenibacillus gyeongsangnamensis TaxID=3388067 RepID=A0ABT4QKS1_9BACL|nr:membrane protein insertase YidC [Paenibacillus filicis]MCZ8517445.1 membrane protein insertase YidC [Paenibacillus filicis]
MTRRLAKYMPFLLILLLLAGCSTSARTSPIDPTTSTWDKYFVGPLANTLDWFAQLLGGSYGLSILVVTVIIRLIILPLTLKQYRSSKRMQELQPELKKLKEKYKDDAKKQQEETMKLFQKEGVNPLAGCLPLVVQMPVLIALYNAIMRNHHISEHSFLWMQLGTKDPFYILPLLAALTTYFQQKMMSSQMNQQMQSLMFIFPVMIFVMAMNFASALPLYWIYSNTFTIVQSYFIYGRPKKNASDK